MRTLHFHSHRFTLAQLVTQHDPFQHVELLPLSGVLAALPVAHLECGAAVLPALPECPTHAHGVHAPPCPTRRVQLDYLLATA